MALMCPATTEADADAHSRVFAAAPAPSCWPGSMILGQDPDRLPQRGRLLGGEAQPQVGRGRLAREAGPARVDDDAARGGRLGHVRVAAAVGQPQPQVHAAAGHQVEPAAGQQFGDRGDQRVPALAQPPPGRGQVPRPARRRQHVQRDLLQHRRHEQVVADPPAPQPGQHRAARRQAGHPQPRGDRLGHRAQVDHVTVIVLRDQRQRRGRAEVEVPHPVVFHQERARPGRGQQHRLAALRGEHRAVRVGVPGLQVRQPAAGPGERVRERVRQHAVGVAGHRHQRQAGRRAPRPARRRTSATRRSAGRRARTGAGTPPTARPGRPMR